MPPIVLWPSLAVTTGFGALFTLGTVFGLLDRLKTARTAERPRPLPALILFATLAVFCWASVYRIFNPS